MAVGQRGKMREGTCICVFLLQDPMDLVDNMSPEEVSKGGVNLGQVVLSQEDTAINLFYCAIRMKISG